MAGPVWMSARSCAMKRSLRAGERGAASSRPGRGVAIKPPPGNQSLKPRARRERRAWRSDRCRGKVLARHSVRPCHCTRGLVHSAALPQNPAGLLPRWASGARHSKVDPEHHLGARFGRAPYGRQDRAAQGASISLRLNDGSLVPLQPTSFVSSSRNEVCALKRRVVGADVPLPTLFRLYCKRPQAAD